MENRASKNNFEKGFTLMELLIVIAIIGILASVVLVSSKSSVDKAKRTSAITSAASALPEFVACADDGGNIVAPASSSNGGGVICSAAGHTATWANVKSSGWSYNASNAASANIGNYTFTMTPPTGDTYPNVVCSYVDNNCY